jgi:hypothetical protein
LVRFAFAGLFVNAFAVACVVSDGDDRDDDNTACEPGDYRDCNCGSDEGTQKCNAVGSGYGACDCSGVNVGGGNSGGEGNTPTAGTAGTAGSTAYGGETSGGAGGEGGATTSQAGEGGEGGAAIDPDAICFEDPGDVCQECVQVSCCEEWKACSEEAGGDCQQQFFNIIACAQTERAERDIKPEDLEACAEEEVAGGGAWSDGLLPTTKALIDCTGGGVDWEGRAWNDASCNSLCFIQE